jgi:hypothetical protein
MAAASGLGLGPEIKEKSDGDYHIRDWRDDKRKPWRWDAKKFIIGLGGSATNDGGMGMAQALGVKFFDSQRQ